MLKEYFFVLKLKNGTTISLWDFIPECEATNKCLTTLCQAQKSVRQISHLMLVS